MASLEYLVRPSELGKAFWCEQRSYQRKVKQCKTGTVQRGSLKAVLSVVRREFMAQIEGLPLGGVLRPGAFLPLKLALTPCLDSQRICLACREKAGLRPCKGDKLPIKLEELWAWRSVTAAMCIGDIAKTGRTGPRSEM